MNIDNRINIVAGRPGAGKTLWAAREVVDCLRDENNIVLYIGFDQEFDRICRMVRAKYGLSLIHISDEEEYNSHLSCAGRRHRSLCSLCYQ